MTTDIVVARREPLDLMKALDYKAPFLIEKLLKERIVETPEHGQQLFVEVVKYLILNRTFPDKHWSMFSRLIDEVWHQFVLFTTEYLAFCTQYFGGYMHHAPSNAPGLEPKVPGSVAIEADQFRSYYERLFGTPLPDLWRDAVSITLRRRVLLSDGSGTLRLEADETGDTIAIVDSNGPKLSVGSLAGDALEFMLRTKAFYVRELPGDLTDDEKIGIVEVLVSQGVLSLAA
jgi:hypothetical protein